VLLFEIATLAKGLAKAGGNGMMVWMTSNDLKGVVHSDPQILGGTPVFAGTRVPLQNLIDFLEGGESIDDFLEGFPSVKREQAIAVIEAGKLKMLETV
jgi:uncharacterized protein (DUF433 family)